MKVLALDIGNTDVSLGIFQDYQLLDKKRLPLILTKQEYFDLLVPYLKTEDLAIGISCVVPKLQLMIEELCRSLTNKVLFITPRVVSDLIILARDRNELGADLICDVYGARQKYAGPILVFDYGSATKTIYINTKGEVQGVNIKPGIGQSLNNMIDKIPHLPNIELTIPSSLLGKDTKEAIQAGILHSEICAIEGFVQKVNEFYKIETTVILTGGYSHIFEGVFKTYNFEGNLVIEGINDIVGKYLLV